MSDNAISSEESNPDVEPPLHGFHAELRELERCVEQARACLTQAILMADRPA